MHGDYSRPPALWTNTSVPTARDLAHWDQAQYAGLDGVNGGSWSPATPIGIGGVGVALGANSLLNGGFVTQYGGRYSLGASDYPVFYAGNRTRSLLAPLRAAAGSSGTLYRLNETISGRVVTRQGWFDPTAAEVYLPVAQRFVHHGIIGGATLLSLTINMFYTVIPTSETAVWQAVLWDVTTDTQYNPSNQWIANTVYSTNATVIPSGNAAQTGYWYRATTGGLSNSPTQPSPWPSVVGNTVVDGTVTWTCEGGAGTIPGSTYSAPAQVLTPITTSITPDTTLEMNVGHAYMIVITQDGNPWVYASSDLFYNSITDMAFA